MSIVRELKRRNVFRMAVLYLVAAWLIMQVVEVLPILDELMETRERGEFYVPAYFTGVIYTQLGTSTRPSSGWTWPSKNARFNWPSSIMTPTWSYFMTILASRHSKKRFGPIEASMVAGTS